MLKLLWMDVLATCCNALIVKVNVLFIVIGRRHCRQLNNFIFEYFIHLIIQFTKLLRFSHANFDEKLIYHLCHINRFLAHKTVLYDVIYSRLPVVMITATPCGESTVIPIVSCQCTYYCSEPIHGKKIH